MRIAVRYTHRRRVTALSLAIWVLGSDLSQAETAEARVEAETLRQLLAQPSKRFESYRFDASSNLADRVYEIPEDLIRPLRLRDRRKDYTPYTPTTGEMLLFASYLDLLPEVNRRLMEERVVAVFFVNNFLGIGMTDWVLDREGKLYFTMIINSNALKEGLSTFLTRMELTCFRINDSTIKIAVNMGSKFRGLLYALMHESVHVVDYLRGITPYPDRRFGKLAGKTDDSTEFTDRFWRTRTETTTEYDPRIRQEVTFFYLDGGPKLNITEAPSIYERLSTMPFVSLYATTNWAEDLADTVTFYHLTKRLNIPYQIHLFKNDMLIAEHVPTLKKVIRERYFPLHVFYGED